MKLEIQENAWGLARKLIADGLDPNETLEFYRGDVLCLRGKADDFAKLRVTTNAAGTPVFRIAEKDGSSLTGDLEQLALTVSPSAGSQTAAAPAASAVPDADPWDGRSRNDGLYGNRPATRVRLARTAGLNDRTDVAG
jgi:hypothetical protein